jgi:hypothetical protein
MEYLSVGYLIDLDLSSSPPHLIDTLMPRIIQTALEGATRSRPGGWRARARQKLSGTNMEPLGVRKTDLLPSTEEQNVERESHERYSAGRKAEWKRRQDVSVLFNENFAL